MSIEWTDEERAIVINKIYLCVPAYLLDALAPFIAAREKAAEQRGAAKALRSSARNLDLLPTNAQVWANDVAAGLIARARALETQS